MKYNFYWPLLYVSCVFDKLERRRQLHPSPRRTHNGGQSLAWNKELEGQVRVSMAKHEALKDTRCESINVVVAVT